MSQSIVYIGDFDFIHHNVQSHLVHSNGQMFEDLGYEVFYLGVNRGCYELKTISDNKYFHLPDTLSISGVFKFNRVKRILLGKLDSINNSSKIQFVVAYQAPTFSPILYSIHSWCVNHNAKFIVNSADLPVFKHGGLLLSSVMYLNWALMHSIIKRKADGIISVSSYINNYFKKGKRPSIVIPPIFDGTVPMFSKSNNECVVFVYAGRPFVVTGKEIKPKGMKDRLDFIVDLFSQFNKCGVSFCFKIIGITKEEYLKSIPNHADILNDLGGKVVFQGKLNHSETISQIASADFMINYRDVNKMTLAGYSTKVVESISIGTPVVVNDIGDTFKYLSEDMGYVLCDSIKKNVSLLKKICHLSKEEICAKKDSCRINNPFVKSHYIDKLRQFLLEVKDYDY